MFRSVTLLSDNDHQISLQLFHRNGSMTAAMSLSPCPSDIARAKTASALPAVVKSIECRFASVIA